MKREHGFNLIELAVGIAIVGIIASATGPVIYHILNNTGHSTDRMVVVQQIANAARWIGRDAYMADSVDTDNLTAPAVLILRWTDWGYGSDNVYYAATYSMENMSGNIGQLKRRLQSSSGIDQQLLIANYVYYNPSDTANTTSASYQSPTVTLKASARFGTANEVKEYAIYRRPNF